MLGTVDGVVPEQQVAHPVHRRIGLTLLGTSMNSCLAPLALFILMVLSSCGDECRNYSDYSCSAIEKANYNVYFYYPSGREEYLGQTEGLPSCGSMAHAFASSMNLERNSEWSYICCMRAKGSECYEKHR